MTMLTLDTHRPAVEWLTDLQKAKADASKPRMSIQDLLERANDPTAPESALIPTSPRSVEACFRLGIDPVEMQFHPIAYYRRNGEDDDITQMRYEKSEAFRQELIRSLIEERKHLIEEGWTGDVLGKTGTVTKGTGTSKRESSGMVEKERQRLEVLKRRQERDLQQMVQYEITRKDLLDKQQKKVDEMDKRAADLVRQKAENDAAWLSRQRELELQKLKEEQELEREAKRIAEERYQREKEQQRKEEEEERRRKREAYNKEMERRQKTEDARRETEAILAQQAEEVRLRKLKMDQLDAERIKRMEVEAKETAKRNSEKRAKAEQRIASALNSNAEIMRKKREDFERRERASEERRQQLAEAARRDEERKRQEEIRKERERQEKYNGALTIEEQRKLAIKNKAEEKERQLAELYAQRKKDNDIRKLEREFELKQRLDKVDSIQKTDMYHRSQLLDRIMDDYERTRSMLRERSDIQEQRKMANLQASLQRHIMSQAMDQLKFTKSIDRLTNGSGTVDINSLLSSSRRPATAM